MTVALYQSIKLDYLSTYSLTDQPFYINVQLVALHIELGTPVASTVGKEMPTDFFFQDKQYGVFKQTSL